MIVPLASSDDIVLDLPYPPSVNRLWRSSAKDGTGKVYLSPSYVKWKASADVMLMAHRGWTMKRITGFFSADIALCPPKGQQRGDIDNRIKALLDFLQRTTVIVNDKHCQLVCAYWVEREMAPEGARVTVKPWKARGVNDVLRTAAERLEAAR